MPSRGRRSCTSCALKRAAMDGASCANINAMSSARKQTMHVHVDVGWPSSAIVDDDAADAVETDEAGAKSFLRAAGESRVVKSARTLECGMAGTADSDHLDAGSMCGDKAKLAADDVDSVSAP